MQIQSLTFGAIEIQDETIYTFPRGIPGLNKITRYALVDVEDSGPYKWLQACEPPYLSLTLLDPHVLVPDYQVVVGPEHREILQMQTGEMPIALCIVVIPKNPKDMTANLLAPILLNPAKRIGAQAIVNGSPDWLRVRVLQET
ncbi:MAG: flagellar assembly protein FliW [Acidobacteria bacterium]|nr:flagellar assembly protein FliW [Acidobacteriota bacterium]